MTSKSNKCLEGHRENQTENVTNGCEILFSACLARCDRVSLKHYCHLKSLEGVPYIDLIKTE